MCVGIFRTLMPVDHIDHILYGLERDVRLRSTEEACKRAMASALGDVILVSPAFIPFPGKIWL